MLFTYLIVLTNVELVVVSNALVVVQEHVALFQHFHVLVSQPFAHLTTHYNIITTIDKLEEEEKSNATKLT